MDKKKVKELITHSILHIDRINMGDIDGFEASVDVKRMLEQALKELSKSDWVSVEDRLPELGKRVNVCNKDDIDDIWTTYRTRNPLTDTDKFEFASIYGHMDITYWRRIEKLEE